MQSIARRACKTAISRHLLWQRSRTFSLLNSLGNVSNCSSGFSTGVHYTQNGPVWNRMMSTAAAEVVKTEPETKVDTDDSKNEVPKDTAKLHSPVSWASLILLIITGVGTLIAFEVMKGRRVEELKNKKLAVEGPSIGKAAIGGPFTLVNHDGKTVTEKDFLGNWTVLYFGFTFCPDICPDELQKMVQAIDAIEKKAGLQVTPVFITVDPERDTVEQIKQYLKEFHPRLIGLTGSVEDINKVAKTFRVYYMKTGDEGDTDYLVDHSIIMYLMDPNMEFVKFYGKSVEAEELSNAIIQEIKQWKPQEEKAE